MTEPDGYINQLSPAEAERLACIAEEAAEVIQVIGKILRHGYESTHPNGGLDNRHLLEKELGDLGLVIELGIVRGDIRPEKIKEWAIKKMDTLPQYLHHNTLEGVVI